MKIGCNFFIFSFGYKRKRDNKEREHNYEPRGYETCIISAMRSSTTSSDGTKILTWSSDWVALNLASPSTHLLSSLRIWLTSDFMSIFNFRQASMSVLSGWFSTPLLLLIRSTDVLDSLSSSTSSLFSKF